jgi:type VI secretion system protein ImpK
LPAEFAVAYAAELARGGSYADAEEILLALPEKDIRVLDLLARICAQQRRFAEAKTFWSDALRMDPSNQMAQNALERIARLQRRPRWLPSPALSLAGIVVAAVVIALASRGLPHREKQLPTTQPRAVSVPAPIPDQPPLSVNGTHIVRSGNAWAITFDEGLFSTGTRLTTKGRHALESFGESVKGQSWLLEIEGDTDGTGVRTGSSVRDNAQLGLRRAEVAATLLHDKYGVNWKAIVMSAGGDAATGPGSDLTKRTVVIRVRQGPVDRE